MKKPSYLWIHHLGFDHVKLDPIEVQLLAGKWGVPRKWLYAAVHSGHLVADTSRRPWVVSREQAIHFENEHIVPLLGSECEIKIDSPSSTPATVSESDSKLILSAPSVA